MFYTSMRAMLVVTFLAFTPLVALAQGPGFGRGHMDASHQVDMTVIHALLQHRDSIDRTVENLPNGVRTVTESDQPQVASWIQDHGEATHDRIKNRRPIHLRDPLFRAIFGQAEKIEMEIVHTEKGIEVTETSDDPWTAQLIQAHAAVVTAFIENGHLEVRKNHPVPAPKK